VDTWWQTETGATLMTPLPGAHALKPGSAAKPFFSIRPQLVDDKGAVLEGPAAGNLCILDSWPGQMRTVYGDHARFVDTYFRTYPGKYFTGDGCRRDADGYYWITGRAPEGGRVRCCRLPAPDQGPGHLRLRLADGGRAAYRRVENRTGPVGSQGDRPDCLARRHPVRTRPAQDAIWQDHAAHPAQDRRKRLCQSGRHINSRGSGRGAGPRQQSGKQIELSGGCDARTGPTRRLAR